MNNVISRQAVVTIDTAALRHNLTQVYQYAPHAKVLAMVKADAYGHGVANCLPALSRADGLGVANFEEAKELRLLGWDKAIVLIEGVFSEAEWQLATTYELSCVVHHQCQLQWALNNPPSPADHPSRSIWLKINTGMNRLGFEADRIIPVAQALFDAGYHLILTSHFANSDDVEHPLNQQQIATFNQVLQQLRHTVSDKIEGSLCNSAAIINFPECHHNWVRPGIMLYGSSPIVSCSAHSLKLQPVMTFSAALMAIHEVPRDACIGYGSRFVTQQSITKGIVSIGYGDGYPRVIADEAWVALVQDDTYYPCPIIGRVAMDMIAIDISNVPNPQLNSLVILWGKASDNSKSNDPANPHVAKVMTTQAVPNVDDVANWAGTIGYELLCRLTSRPKRQLS